MISDLEFSRSRTDDTSAEHEEIQIFNNQLFAPTNRSDLSITHPATFGDQSPIQPQRRSATPGRDDMDNIRWLENDSARKGTLDLNYPAEVRGYQSNRPNYPSKDSNLDDLLKDADSAVRRSQSLVSKIQENVFRPSQAQGQYRPPAENSWNTRPSLGTTSGYTPNTFDNPYGDRISLGIKPMAQEPSNYPPQIPLNSYGSPLDAQWNTSRQPQSQPQPQYSGNTDSSNDPRLSNRYGPKIGRSYDLFPIQEALETGHETPRDSKKTNLAFPQARTDHLNEKIQALHTGYPTSLADRVLSMNPEPRDFASFGMPNDPYAPNRRSEDYMRPSLGSSREEPLYSESDLQPKTLMGDIRHSARPDEDRYSIGSNRESFKDPYANSSLPRSSEPRPLSNSGAGPETMDRKIDEIIRRHLLGNEDGDGRPKMTAPPNLAPVFDDYGSSRNSYNENKYYEDPSRIYPVNSNGSRASPNTLDLGPISTERKRMSPGEALPTFKPAEASYPVAERNQIPLREITTNDLHDYDDRMRKSERENDKKSTNYSPVYELTSPHSGSQGPFSNGSMGNSFTSPLLQKYTNPFIDEHLQNIISPKAKSLHSMHDEHETVIDRPSAEAEKKKSAHQGPLPQVKGVTDPLFHKEDLRNGDLIKIARRPLATVLKPPKSKVRTPTFNAQDLEDDLEVQAPKPDSVEIEPIRRVYKAQDLEDDITTPSKPIKPIKPMFYAQDLENDNTPKSSPNLQDEKKSPSQFAQGPEESDSPNMGNSPISKGQRNSVNQKRNPIFLKKEPEVNKEPLPKAVNENSKAKNVSPNKWRDQSSRTSEDNFDAEKYNEPVHDMVLVQETSPDKKMKKLTFKNRPSEGANPDRKSVGMPEDNNSAREEVPQIRESSAGPKQRKKIFETKSPEPNNRLQEEVMMGENLLKGMGRDSEKPKKAIVIMPTEAPKKTLEPKIAQPWEENLATAEAEEGDPTDGIKQANATAPGAKLGNLNKEKNSSINNLMGRESDSDGAGYDDIDEKKEDDKLPYQLNNGAMDISQSYFDFDNEKVLNYDDYSTVTKDHRGSSSQRDQKHRSLTSMPQDLASNYQSMPEKPSSAKIWVVDNSEERQSKRGGVSRSQSLSQSLKKVPLIEHCFEKFDGISQGFPKIQN